MFNCRLESDDVLRCGPLGALDNIELDNQGGYPCTVLDISLTQHLCQITLLEQTGTFGLTPGKGEEGETLPCTNLWEGPVVCLDPSSGLASWERSRSHAYSPPGCTA